MKSILLRLLLVSIFAGGLTMNGLAQNDFANSRIHKPKPAPKPKPKPNKIPIDGGISLLVAAGAAYGVSRLAKKKKEVE